MNDIDDIPVTEEHQAWRNSKAAQYMREIDEKSRKLREIVGEGAVLSQIDRDKGKLLSERIHKIADREDGQEA